MSSSVLLLTDDTMMAVRLQDTAEKLGYAVALAASEQEFGERLAEQPDLVLVDASARAIDWPELVRRAKAGNHRLVAFGNHMDLAARDRALAAGADTVVANAAIATDLKRILSRHTAVC